MNQLRFLRNVFEGPWKRLYNCKAVGKHHYLKRRVIDQIFKLHIKRTVRRSRSEAFCNRNFAGIDCRKCLKSELDLSIGRVG